MTPSFDRGRRMQSAAQALVDWYVTSYGARRARRYLGACERQGLSLPKDSGRATPGWPLVVGIVALLLVLASWGRVEEIAGRVAASHRSHTEVKHDQH